MYITVIEKVMAHATARRSSCNLFITCSSGGIKIGMKAMCTGIMVPEAKPARIRPINKAHLMEVADLPVSALWFTLPISQLENCWVRPVRDSATANAPNVAYANATGAPPPKPLLNTSTMVLTSMPESKPAVIAPIIKDKTTETRIKLSATTTITAIMTEFISFNPFLASPLLSEAARIMVRKNRQMLC